MNDECEDEWQDDKISLAPRDVGSGAQARYRCELATGDILVFLDDDSYPNPDLLDVADRHFENDDVPLRRPGITPRKTASGSGIRRGLPKPTFRREP